VNVIIFDAKTLARLSKSKLISK